MLPIPDTAGRVGEIVSFSINPTFPKGNRRSGTAASFTSGVAAAVDARTEPGATAAGVVAGCAEAAVRAVEAGAEAPVVA